MIDDPLEELKMVPPHIDDDGFTLRVMAALPKRRLDLGPWLDGATVMALTLVALLTVPELLGAGSAWLAETAHLPLALAPSVLLAALAAGGGALLGGWWMAQGGQSG